MAVKSFPMQPIERAKDGVMRFKENRIVTAFYDAATNGEKLTLHDIAIRAAHGEFTAAEQMQFAQIIGYSISGFGDLPYVEREVLRRAERKAVLLA